MDLEKCKAKYWLQLQIDDVDLTDSHICAGSNTWLLQQHEEACKVCFFEDTLCVTKGILFYF